MQKWLIIDFDSTINKLEALDELAKIVSSRKGSENIPEEIKRITEMGMRGEITFPESLKQRMQLLKFNRAEMQLLINHLQKNFTDSFLQNIHKLEEISDQVIIISGGFKDFIDPALKDFKLKPANIYANTFLFDENNECIGFDESNLLALDQGKVNMVNSLNLDGEVIVVGDGYTDYQIKEKGAANTFIAFTENVYRANVAENADLIAKTFDDVIQYFHN